MDEKKRQSLISESETSDSMIPGFFDGIVKVVGQARAHIKRLVNVAMCVTYYEVGRLIVEQKQAGAANAVCDVFEGQPYLAPHTSEDSDDVR